MIFFFFWPWDYGLLYRCFLDLFLILCPDLTCQLWWLIYTIVFCVWVTALIFCLILQSSIHFPFLLGVLITKPHVIHTPEFHCNCNFSIDKVWFNCNVALLPLLINGWKSGSVVGELNAVFLKLETGRDDRGTEPSFSPCFDSTGSSISLVPGAFLFLRLHLPSPPRPALVLDPFPNTALETSNDFSPLISLDLN